MKKGIDPTSLIRNSTGKWEFILCQNLYMMLPDYNSKIEFHSRAPKTDPIRENKEENSEN
uniref:Uncharacterized protein n=1 Tax=Rhizophora mucronata TaxID=61149 RepID=A0A2P2JQ85_RHIMU